MVIGDWSRMGHTESRRGQTLWDTTTVHWKVPFIYMKRVDWVTESGKRSSWWGTLSQGYELMTKPWLIILRTTDLFVTSEQNLFFSICSWYKDSFKHGLILNWVVCLKWGIRKDILLPHRKHFWDVNIVVNKTPIITELRKAAWADLHLLSGSGEWTACGSSNPALQQPPRLCFTSQHHASNCLWPSALAPSSAQQWTLKPAGGSEENPTFITQMGGSVRHTWHRSSFYICTEFLFFIHVFLHVIYVHLPVTSSEKSNLYMCALSLQSRKQNVRVQLLWGNCPIVFISTSYYKHIIHICMIKRCVVYQPKRLLNTMCLMDPYDAAHLLAASGA